MKQYAQQSRGRNSQYIHMISQVGFMVGWGREMSPIVAQWNHLESLSHAGCRSFSQRF